MAQAAESNAKRVLLATDSSTLNYPLMKVAIAVSPSRPPVEIIGLAWRTGPIEDDFHDIREADLVVFQDKPDVPFTNQRVAEYEQYTRQHFGDVAIKVVDGIRIYGVSHS